MTKRCPYDFEIFQGDDYDFSATYQTAEGTVIPLTGYTAAMQARANFDSATPVLDLDMTDGITIDAPAGTVYVVIDHETASGIPPGIYVYDLEITAPDGKVFKLLFGKITILGEVTR